MNFSLKWNFKEVWFVLILFPQSLNKEKYNQTSLNLFCPEIDFKLQHMYYMLVFTWVSKIIRACFGFASLCSVISFKNLRHFLNQSEVKPKPITTCPCTFSRASWQLVHVFASSFDWFTGLSVSKIWLARMINLVLVYHTHLKTALYLQSHKLIKISTAEKKCFKKFFKDLITKY